MRSRLWLFSLTLLALGAHGAGAATLNVAAGGIDGDGCGSKALPCRSITRAIALAVDGDKILVGPGRYGDLDADGTRGETGEEGSASGLVLVDKRVAIESTQGAATTLIDAAGAPVNAVDIAASGATFGKAKKGFTITRSQGAAVFIDPQATGVTIAGIRAVRNGSGILTKAPGLILRDNVAEANDGNGFSIAGSASTLTACRATGNGENGFLILGQGVVVKSSVASANAADGFSLGGGGATLTNSVATGNNVGLRIGGAAPGILGTNSFLGNAQAGIVVTTPNVTITKTNVFGNGSTGATNCGILTAGAGSVNADGVCFGAPTGPGDDPADQICGTIIVLEIVDKVIKVTPKVPL